MPGRNGTGPLGMGSLTGRGLGPCGGGYFSYRRPRLGFRNGYRRGLRYYGYYEPYSTDRNTERDFMEEEKAMLEARLRDINEILDESKNKKE